MATANRVHYGSFYSRLRITEYSRCQLWSEFGVDGMRSLLGYGLVVIDWFSRPFKDIAQELDARFCVWLKLCSTNA
ncbi:hypothetical protein [Allocoleopsis franciscana]|uniref:Uncharacterized protein n=1 Tax=Allocoleopsis franciscana PCC 7113 TaxID=1173027 RepID=K9WAX3_9CYAN|nr:hypothetical protein [Allocoleopsis franciscana]AFZ16966.1 hypothetical protein Mic7113_1072 [Allocoleopsis franciscana PCC 7113]